MSSPEAVPIPAITRWLVRLPVAALLVDLAGTIDAANDAAAHLVGESGAAAIVGESVFQRTPEDEARHRLRDVAEGIVVAALANIDLPDHRGNSRAFTAWWRRVLTDQGPRALVVLTPPDLHERPTVTPPPPGGLALVTTDHDWRVVDLSVDAEGLIGSAEALTGQGLLGLIHPLDLIECISALALRNDSVRTVTVNLRFHAVDRWQPVSLTATRLCRHEPPRLVCLLSPQPSSAQGTPEDHLDALLEQRETGQLLSHVGRALDRLATTHDLSSQQVEIIARSVRGQGPQKIARSMHMSEGTVRNALTALYRKFEVHTQLELVSAVLAAG